MKLPTLFARDSKGRTKQWSVYSEDLFDGTAQYVVTHGLRDGKKQVSPKHIKVGKNLGKANETTTFEQASSEAQSKWNKQIDKGYVEDPDNIPWAWELENFLPMLADKWEKKAKHIKFPAYVQPKLDGFRCVSGRRGGDAVVLWSRARKKFAVPHLIIAELETVMGPSECRDGELYRHDWRSPSNEADFQRISASVKKWRSDTDLLEYHVYDRPIPEKPEATFYERFYKPAFIDKTLVGTERVKIVPTFIVNSADELMELFEKWTSQDLPYEGAMIRNKDGVYGYDDRSDDLLKVKDFDEDEFEVVGGREATGKDAGTVVFLCVTQSGIEFESRPTGTYEQRAEYLENLDTYIGKMLKVQFNGYTNDGLPRFNRGVAIRPNWDIT